MPENTTNFLTDLSDPSSGERSELFRAVRPLLQSPGIDAPKTPYDVARLDKLKDSVRRGVVGLEYLTGLKNNEVETFYDAHPAEAVTSNVLGSSAGLGLSAAVGVPAKNLHNQWQNLKHTEHAFHARRDDPKQQAEQRLYPGADKANQKLNVDEDVLRVFGDGRADLVSKPRGGAKSGQGLSAVTNEEAILRRMQALDAVSGSAPGPNNTDKIKKLLAAVKAKPSDAGAQLKLTTALENLRGSDANKALRSYVDLHKDLSSLQTGGHKLKGDALGSLGDALRESSTFNNAKNFVTSKSPALGATIDSAIPTKHQGLEDLVRKRILQPHPNAYNEDLLKKILADTQNVDFVNSSPEAVSMERSMLSSLRNPGTRGTLNKTLRRFGPSALFGLGVGGAGLGMSSLLKLIQQHRYGGEQIKEWKRNSLKAKGEFDAAERIK